MTRGLVPHAFSGAVSEDAQCALLKPERKYDHGYHCNLKATENGYGGSPHSIGLIPLDKVIAWDGNVRKAGTTGSVFVTTLPSLSKDCGHRRSSRNWHFRGFWICGKVKTISNKKVFMSGSEGPPESQPKHAERIRRRRPKKPNLNLSPDSKYDWPANFGELIEWYTYEVEDITRAAQLRIKDATALLSACANREISLEEAAHRIFSEYDERWRDIFPDGVNRTRDMSNEEIYKAMRDAREEAIERDRNRRDNPYR
jgi:hypothetical protein